jgi:hypothetical protein
MCNDFIHYVLMEQLKYSVCVESKTAMSHISLFSNQSVSRTDTNTMSKLRSSEMGRRVVWYLSSTFLRNLFFSIVTLNLEVADSRETSVPLYQTAGRHIPNAYCRGEPSRVCSLRGTN